MEQTFSIDHHHASNICWPDHYYQSDNCYRTAAYMFQNGSTSILLFFFKL